MLEAFHRNDLRLVEELVRPDLVYTIPGRSFLGGRTVGVEAHLEVLARARRASGGTLRLVPAATAVDGDYLLIFGTITAERAGRRLEGPHSVMYRFDGERVAEGRTIPFDLYAFDDFWGTSSE